MSNNNNSPRRQRLLVCIPFHHHAKGMSYLSVVLEELIMVYSREMDVRVIVDTNCDEGKTDVLNAFPQVDVRVHSKLAHPFHLTWMHRWHIHSFLDFFDMFMYVEYDLLLPFENFKKYIENFRMLWGRGDGVPALFRVELNFGEGRLYSTDAEQRLGYDRSDRHHVVSMENKTFTRNLPHPLPYHGMWIATQEALKDILPNNFRRLEVSRECAASFLIWEMRKIGYIEMDEKDGSVSHQSLIYHLPSNYTNDPHERLGKIPFRDAIFLQ